MPFRTLAVHPAMPRIFGDAASLSLEHWQSAISARQAALARLLIKNRAHAALGATGALAMKSKRNKSMNTLELKGNWNIAKGKLKQKWASLTDDDLEYVEGQQDELVGRIQKRTGQTKEAVEKALKDSCECDR